MTKDVSINVVKMDGGNPRQIRMDAQRPSNANQYAPFSAYEWYGIVKYDDDNLYTDRILELKRSAIHNAILKTKINMTIADGLVYDEESAEGIKLKKWFDLINVNKLIAQSAHDIVVFGGLSWKIILGAYNTAIVAVDPVPFSNVRWAISDKETGQYNGLKVCPAWIYFRTGFLKPHQQPRYYDLWKGASTIANDTKFSIKYEFFYNASNELYPEPDYMGGIEWIRNDIRLAELTGAQINNAFMPSAIIAFPDEPTAEKKEERIKDFLDQFTGTKNSGQLIFTFGGIGGNEQTVMPEITPLSINNNAEMYAGTLTATQQQIVSAHQLPSPTLAGLPGNGGLGGNANEINVSAELFYKLCIRNYQTKIIDNLRELAKLNGLSTDFDLGYKPLLSSGLEDNYGRNYLSINEMRERNGFEAIDDELANTVQYINEQKALQQGSLFTPNTTFNTQSNENNNLRGAKV
jgi:hypothetical protein